jgi:hypothetical protein
VLGNRLACANRVYIGDALAIEIGDDNPLAALRGITGKVRRRSRLVNRPCQTP